MRLKRSSMARRVRELVLGSRGLQGPQSRVSRGHPWIWRDAIDRGLEDASAGDYVQVVAPDGEPIGCGIVDPTSPIAVRLWTRGRTAIGSALLEARAERAFALREVLAASDTNAYRVVHGEGDRMPGLVVDRYDSVAVMRTDGAAAGARSEDFAKALWPVLARAGVLSLVHRIGAKGQEPRLDLLRGDPPPPEVHVREYGVPFVVDLAHGQKTGAFLDQRDNRRRVGELARGRRVLNLFSYAGGFSLRAALGGASHVTNVDIAARAHATAQASFRLAGLDPAAHAAFVTAEVHAFLESARSRGETWDLIVSDPPSFAPSEKALPRALAAYRALHRACVEVLSPRGILCASSCSSHVDAASFMQTLDDAALGDRELTVVELSGAGTDHPCVPAFPEGRYLKFAVLM